MPTLTARTLITPIGEVAYPSITADSQGRIADISTDPTIRSQSILTPAFLDIHIHGAAGHDVMSATPEGFTAIGRFLARHGTGHLSAHHRHRAHRRHRASPRTHRRPHRVPHPARAKPLPSASTSKAPSSPTPSAASTPPPCSSRRASPSSTASSKPRAATSSSSPWPLKPPARSS